VSKVLIPTQACLLVGTGTWDTPKHEEEVGQGPHEFRMVGRIAGAIRDITFGSHIIFRLSYPIFRRNEPMSTFWKVLLIILLVLIAVLVVLYFLGRKLQAKQAEQKDAIEAAKQTVNLLVIDKKRMKIKDSGLPKIVYEQTPRYMRWAKLPIVKAKVGPKIMTLVADDRVFPQIPLRQEIKAVISGIYIMEVRPLRGNTLPQPEKKKGLFSRFRKNKPTEKKSPEKGSAGKTNQTEKGSAGKTGKSKK